MYGVFCSVHNLFSEEIILDTIVSIVSSPVGTEIITQSDVDRPTLFGQYRTLEDCELEKAILLEAKKHHISVDDAMIEAYLQSIQQAYNITREEIQGMFRQAGYSEHEAREQLRSSQINNIILQREVYENISVSRQDIELYYLDNPDYEKTSYLVQRAVIIISSEESMNDIIAENTQLNFSQPILLYEPDLSEQHQFVITMTEQEMRAILIDENTYEVIKLVEKNERRLKSLEERYDEIAVKVQKEQYETLFAQFKKRMIDSVSIVRM
jgi:parvulin-like peptidyl-prolyl isomerase